MMYMHNPTFDELADELAVELSELYERYPDLRPFDWSGVFEAIQTAAQQLIEWLQKFAGAMVKAFRILADAIRACRPFRELAESDRRFKIYWKLRPFLGDKLADIAARRWPRRWLWWSRS